MSRFSSMNADRRKNCDSYEILIYAESKAFLKSQGNLIDDFDLLIGSTALANDIMLKDWQTR